MIRSVLFATALCLAPAETSAQPVNPAIADKVVSIDAFPPAKASYPGGVTGHADVIYATVPGFRPLTLDLYAQAPAARPRPLVIYIHGGGWSAGTSRNAAAYADFPAVLASLAARGYVVASLNYRLSGEARFPAAPDDVDAAIRWLKANAARYGADASRVAIWGGSAGGQLASLAATDCSDKGGDCVQAAAIWYGVFDFATLPTAGNPNGYLGCAANACADVAAKASAVTFIKPDSPPFLLIHGADDKTVPVTQSREMLAKLKATGVAADFIELPGIDHSFIGKTPAETKAAHLKALQATFDFFDRTVGRR